MSAREAKAPTLLQSAKRAKPLSDTRAGEVSSNKWHSIAGRLDKIPDKPEPFRGAEAPVIMKRNEKDQLWPVGGGEMGALMRRFSWQANGLGPVEKWPESLRQAVNITLSVGFPAAVLWGKESILLYNDAYAVLVGSHHPQALGHPLLEIFPEVRDPYEPFRERVFRGETIALKDQLFRYARDQKIEDRWFTFSYSPLYLENGSISGLCVIGLDTTTKVLAQQERTQVEAVLRESQARQAFLLELNDRTNPLTDTGEIIGLTTRLLGVRLGVERCGYGEIDETGEFVVIEHEWTSGVLPGLAGRIRLNEYGRAAIEEYRAGRTLVLKDAQEDVRTQDTKEAYARIALRAALGVPLIRAGRFVAVLYVHSIEARDWTQAEIELVEAVASRLWAVIERARAEEALRKSEARHMYLLKLSDALRTLGGPMDIQTVALRVLGEYLGGDRVFYARINEEKDEYVIDRNYAKGVPPLIGRFRLSEIRRTAELAGSGQIVVVNDANSDLRLSETERASYAAMNMAAAIGVPLIKDGRWVAGLGIQQAAPRNWTPEEISLVRETAERMWPAVERASAEAALRNALAEKEALLKEVHHRVKNNLQVITSLINLQAAHVKDKQVLALFEETRNRVQSISSIHELLYGSTDFAAIDMAAYARQLVPDLVRFYGMEDRLEASVLGEAFTLELERAVPYGLLLNELVSNVCKHAFPGERRGAMILSFTRDDGHIVLTVADNGVGLPEGFDYRHTSSLGLKLVHNLARQMRATIDIQSAGGTQMTVRVPGRREMDE